MSEEAAHREVLLLLIKARKEGAALRSRLAEMERLHDELHTKAIEHWSLLASLERLVTSLGIRGVAEYDENGEHISAPVQ